MYWFHIRRINFMFKPHVYILNVLCVHKPNKEKKKEIRPSPMTKPLYQQTIQKLVLLNRFKGTQPSH